MGWDISHDFNLAVSEYVSMSKCFWMHVCLTFPVAYNMAGKRKKVPSFVNSRNTSVEKKLKMRSQNSILAYNME